jgi:hypothetical protein
METKLNANKLLFNKLNDYFEDNIRVSSINESILIIVTKEDLFYCIDINNENIPTLIINDDNSVIESMIIKHLCYKQINDFCISYDELLYPKYCFARNEYNIYYYDIKYGVIKKCISEEKIIDMCCGYGNSILLTQSGKVYEYLVNEEISGELEDIIDLKERENSEKYICFKLKSFKNYSFENEKMVMISCGLGHSLALTESGRVFGWGDNCVGQLGVDVRHSSEPIIIELNDLKIKKISCGRFHSLLLSRDGDVYAFGGNHYGEVGNGTGEEQRFPKKLELIPKFIDIASHLNHRISMSQSIDGIYYVWGEFEGKRVCSPQPTKYLSYEEILVSNDFTENRKTFEKLIEFKDSYIRNSFYTKNFEEIKKLGSGSFGSVFKVKGKRWSGRAYSAIKRIEFTSIDTNEIIREYLNYKILTRKYSNFETNYSYIHFENLVEPFDAWFEDGPKISLYIEMELCDKTLDDVINEFDKESHLKTNGTLTTVGYYIASQIFIQILKGVNYLHKENPPLIHRDLKPGNILLKKGPLNRICVKIADFGLMAIHKFSQQTHSLDKGTPKYTAPEVISSKEYDTKADIYSSGIIFLNLFDFELIE